MANFFRTTERSESRKKLSPVQRYQSAEGLPLQNGDSVVLCGLEGTLMNVEIGDLPVNQPIIDIGAVLANSFLCYKGWYEKEQIKLA